MAKFILLEKYILNEDILEEATATDTGTALVSSINSDIPTLKANIEAIKNATDDAKRTKDLTDALKQLNSAAEEINNTTKLPGDHSVELQSELATYSTALDKVVTLADKINPANKYGTERQKFDADIKKFRTAAGKTPWGEKEVNTAIARWRTIHAEIEVTFKTNELTADKSAIVKKLKETCDKVIAECDNAKDAISLDIITELTADAATKAALDSYVAVLDSLYKSIKPIVDLTVPTSIRSVNNINKLQKALDSIIESFSQLMADATVDRRRREADRAAHEREVNDELANSQKADWGTIYARLQNPDERKAFWDGDTSRTGPLKDGYYKLEWGAVADQVKALGASFTNTLIEVGWDSLTNPFVKYLKDRESLLASGKINLETFVPIYNAWVNRILTLSDIRGTGTFKEYNVIFNNELFNVGNDLQNYLKLQNAVRQRASDFNATLKGEYSKDPGKILANFMYTEGDTGSLVKDLAPKTGSFRSPTAIKQLLEIHAGKSMDDEKPEITSDIIDRMLERITSDVTAKKMISYLVDAWRLNYSTYLDDVEKATGNKLYSTRDSVRPTYSETRQYDKDLMLGRYEYSGKSVKKLLLGLAKKANLVA